MLPGTRVAATAAEGRSWFGERPISEARARLTCVMASHSSGLRTMYGPFPSSNSLIASRKAAAAARSAARLAHSALNRSCVAFHSCRVASWTLQNDPISAFLLRQFEGSIFHDALAAREVLDRFSKQGSHARLGSQRARRRAGFGHVQSLVANALHNLEHIGAHVDGHGREERTEPAPPRMNRDWDVTTELFDVCATEGVGGVNCPQQDNVNMATNLASHMVQKRVTSL